MRSRLVFSITLTVATALAGAANSSSVVKDGWTITADGDRGVLTIDHSSAGKIIEDVRLGIRTDRGVQQFANWSVEKNGDQVAIRTVQPRAGWVFEPGENTLRVSCTSSSAVLIARAPAKERLVARLLDPQGAPVSWSGTNETAESYGGSLTRNPSFLPARNPEVMYFALGPVSGAGFHSFFDRPSDTAIDFPDGTAIHRRRERPDQFDITIPVPGNALVRLIPDYYTKTLGVPNYVPFDDTYFSRAPGVWSSWTSYYAEVTEQDILRNADWIADHLKPYGFEYVELDDGYDRGKNGEHYWIENWDRAKFPHGPEWLVNYIKSKGLHAGLWFVPNAYAGAVESHPDWYVRYKDGRIVQDYKTPALDSSNPQVLAFLKREFSTLHGWGFEYFKFDGEHAIPKYVPGVDLNKLANPSMDPLAVYRSRLALIRETIGPKTFIEVCPAGSPVNGIGFVNSYFNGQDLYNSWQGMYTLFGSINSNAFLNHVVAFVMPGEGMEVGPPMTVAEAEKERPASVVQIARTREDPLAGFGTTMDEARTIVSYVALTGVVYPLASILPELPEERVKLLQATLPTLPIFPVDLFSRGPDPQWDTFKHTQPDYYIHNYPDILDLKVNAKSGVYDVAALTNWRSEKVTRKVIFADKLGLDADSEYLVFDYWHQKILGVFKREIELEIMPHETRVLLIHALEHRPQLAGLSRHISGAYSIENLSWDGSKNRLLGSSTTVPGEAYSLWVYVPKGTVVTGAHASTAGGREIPVRRTLSDDTLLVTFTGQLEPLEWHVDFAVK